MEDNFMYSSIISNQENFVEKCMAPNVPDRFGSLSTSAAHSKSSLEDQRNEISNTGKVWPYNGPLEDASNEKYKEGENIVRAGNLSLTSNWETDDLWGPPEPEDKEDDKEDSVANSDDDDDNYSDGTKWSQPSSLGRFSGDHAFGSNYEEERKKAMMEAMNGQFKFLVSRFLASESISCSKEDADNGWLDIVASLSWEAALMIKPDAHEGREMDPASYVKVKCVAHGSRTQSEVIKGLVFKKNTAHKHMPTNVRNPRLLLLKGVLGEHRAGLSSFNAMMQDNNDLKSLIEVIETCNPNVILVEKTASRDVQEKLLDKKITLVFDMKLVRLEKIARCTASPIISGDNIPISTKLRQCDYFHIERFTEEHNHTEGGKKPSKTLMFFEGCPKPLGCTILLKGAHSDELKKVKRVMYYTVFAAYHLILETSFFADQRAISCDSLDVDGQNSCTNQFASFATYAAASTVNSNRSTSDGSDSVHAVDIPIFDESIQKPDLELVKSNSDIDNAGYCADVTANASVSVMSDKNPDVTDSHTLVLRGKHNESSLPLLPGQISSPSPKFKTTVTDYFGFGSYDFFTPYFNYPGNDSPPETVNIETEGVRDLEEVKAQGELSADAKIVPVLDLNESLERVPDANNQVNIPHKGDIGAVLDPQSILVLFSSRSILKDTVCEQSHLTRIKYYGNFDISVGRFLQDILLSEKRNCVGCGASPASHIYSYTHKNGKLTVQVKQIRPASHLHGAAQGKIWMWTRCLKCHRESGIPRPTRRVVMSTAARGLSFGKFLELSFSEHSAARRLSRCGHLLHRDCLRFFGLGSKVAMFKYSQVEIFTACKPPPLLEFSSPAKQEWFEKGAKDVRESGGKLFSNIESLLQEASSEFSGRPVNLTGSNKAFSEVMGMLNQEKLNFEKVTGHHEISSPSSIYQLFDLTFLKQELLLQLYVWDNRLQSLPTCKINNDATDKKSPGDGICSASIDDENALQDGEGKIDNSRMSTMIEIEESSCGQSNVNNANASREIYSAESLVERSDGAIKFIEDISDEKLGKIINRESMPIRPEDKTFLPDEKTEVSFASSTSLNDDNLGSFEMQVEKDVAADPGHSRSCNSSAKSGLVIDHGNFNVERLPSTTDFANICDTEGSVNIMVKGNQNWIWNPFQEIRRAFWKDHSNGYSQKFRFIFSYSPEYLPALHQLNVQERERLCYPVDEVVICLHEEEISSIIACALALYRERFVSPDEIEVGKDRARGEHEVEDVHSSVSDGSSTSSTVSMNLERIQSWQSFSSMSSDELSTFGADGSLFVDRLLSSESLHPEIQLGFDNITGKSKYSVVCIYAKHFLALRKHCCPSEMAYVSSLSRCKKWDVKGGKSKAEFAKTLDDRFIIKEIKKAELASFLKFAPEYFKHVSESLKSGSQTCLAKILGIYQVTQNKSGIKMDLMVMENLLFGRNVSRTYDLKGAVFSRYNSDADKPDAVLLDQNFVEDMGLSPTYVGGRTKHLLQRAIWNDTSFLTSINVMDYSLLVGVDKERHHLVFGIIDYLRQYTWDKQLENWVKLSLVVPKNTSPTVVSPKEYKKRFRKFMSKYFLTVPDSWTTDRGLDACRSCTDIVDSSSQTRHSDFRDKSTQLSAGV